jgi:hypothetical protein
MHNRRGSVLLMAIGMLTILAILASTFLVISNLDSEEAESLAVRACADPIVDGLLAKAIAQISQDRQVNANVPYVPYGAMLPNSNGLVSFMDCPHAYTTNANAETTDPWLSSSYVPGEGISGPGQLTNLEGPTNAAAYKLDSGIKFAEATAGTYTDDQYPSPVPTTGTDPLFVCTDGDKVPDAVLYNTNISSPLSDANTYYAAVRIEDLGARMCINTASGWDSSESQSDRPSGSGPDMVDLRTFLDKRSGNAAPILLYPLLNAGDTASGAKGRIGDATASTKNYSRYCGSYLLSPGKDYQPFGIGDEVFFLNACSYLDNMSQFGGRINQMISAKSTTTTPLLDNIRRQLTTMNCVSSLVRWPNTTVTPNFTEPLVINTVQTLAECQAVYDRMKLMLDATGIGKTPDDRTTMAAHFAANLWAYCSQEGTGAPWKFTTGGITVYGLRQDLVITQVFARHIANTKFGDGNDPSKDDSAWGYAIEISNPTESSRTLSEYEFEIKSQDGSTVIVPLEGDGSSIAGALATATTPNKRVVYGCGSGPARPLTTLAQRAPIFGETPVSTVASTWYQNILMDFRKATSSISITLYRKVGGERVPIDFVTVGNNASFDLPYNTSLQPTDISGDYPAKKPPTRTDNPYVYIRRDDRMKTASSGGTRLARFNLAVYKCDGPTESAANLAVGTTKLGLANAIVLPTELNRCTYRTPISGIYSPGIYRPRNVTVAAAPSARESMPQDAYFLPSLADLDNIYFAGPFRQGATERPFTIGILQTAKSVLFTDRADCGRMPTVNIAAPDVAGSPQANGKYPNIPQGFLFHEFFARTPGHQARTNEKKRIYGMININTVAIPANVTYNCAAYWLPWPKTGSAAPYNRLALGQGGAPYVKDTADGAISYIRKYRDQVDRGWVGIAGLRSAPSNIEGFLTPGEVGIPLARYFDEKVLPLASRAPANGAVPDVALQDADYVRTRNCLFGYISDGIATRSDVYACYVTVQHGKIASGRRWRYVAVIDRSNVINPTDKAALIMLTQLR